jgi:hypothetical protein
MFALCTANLLFFSSHREAVVSLTQSYIPRGISTWQINDSTFHLHQRILGAVFKTTTTTLTVEIKHFYQS